MFKLSFLSDGKRFSIPYKSTKNIAIKYTIANNLDAKIIFLDSKLSEWCRSESPDVAGGAIYWPDFLQNKRLQREFKSIKFDLDPNKEYNITFEVDGTQCTNFQKDAKCRVELGFGGFL